MQRLILINGLGGSGKTTVGRLLLDLLPSAAYFDFDSVTCVSPFEYGEPMFELGHRNAAAVAKNFLSAGYDSVVMCSGCGSQKHLDQFLSLLPERLPVFWFFLQASKDERKRRKSLRARDGADNEAHFDILEAKIGSYAGLVSGPGVKAFEIISEGKPAEKVALELESIIVQNAG